MKQIIILIGFGLSVLCLHSQELQFKAPNYDSIESQIADSNSIFYYPKLLQRYNDRDTSLDLDEYRYLYFGYTFQPQYEPYWRSPYEEQLVEYYRKPQIKEKEYDEIIRLASLSLKDFPFDLRQMNFLAYVYQLKGDMKTANRLRYIFGGIIDAILSSGDGMKCETGMHVISTSHEYVILNLFQFEFTSQSLTKDFCDYMQVEKDKRNIEGLYFNITRLWNVNLNNMKNEKK